MAKAVAPNETAACMQMRAMIATVSDQSGCAKQSGKRHQTAVQIFIQYKSLCSRAVHVIPAVAESDK